MLSSNHIPEGWVESTLNELAFINPRESIRKGELAKNVPMDCIDSFTRKISRFGIKEFKGGTKFKNKDTLLARITPCLENGKTALVDILDKDEIGFGSTEYIVIRENNDRSHYKFLYYLSISPKFRRNAIKSMTGTSGRQRVQTDVLINKVFRFPPLPEQKAIAKVLTAFDDKIELLQAQNKTLETMAQTIFKEWFGKYQIGDELPEGWSVGEINDLVEFVIDNRGKTPPLTDQSNESYPLIEVNSITGDDRNVNLALGKKFVDEETYQNWFRKGHPQNGDILLSTVGSIGQLAQVFNEKICVAQNIVALRSNTSGNFLYELLKRNKKLIINLDISSVQPSIKVPHLISMPVVVPKLELIQRFDRVVNKITIKITSNNQQIQSLTKTRDTLLPKLMSGQVRVNNLKQTANA